MRDPLVSIVRCPDPHDPAVVEEAVRNALDLIGGLAVVVGRGDHVLVKPNLCIARPYTTGTTTNPAVVSAIIRLCKDAGARRVIVGEASMVGVNTDEAFDLTGMRRVVEEAGAVVVNFEKEPASRVIVADAGCLRRLRAPESVLSADVIINVPVVKTHSITGLTIGLKNMKGILYDVDAKRVHRWNLSVGIVDINRAFLPELTIVDGTIGMEGFGPLLGDPAGLGLIFASTDTVAADTVAAHVVGYAVEEVEHVALAGQASLGCASLSEITAVGCDLEAARRPYKRHVLKWSDYGDFEVVTGGACSGCQHMVETLVTVLESRSQLDFLQGRTLVFGQTVVPPERPRESLMLLGNCLRRYRRLGAYYPGCPPMVGGLADTGPLLGKSR